MPPATSDSKLKQRYQFNAVVGHGGAGEVSTAWDTQLERTVAIKRLKPDGIQENTMKSAWQEAMRLASIRHSNIVTVYDMGMAEEIPYIVMEYVNGETVDKRVASRGVLGFEEFVDVAQQSLEGIVAAHHAGLIHRDLKPTNLMLALLPTGRTQVKVLDFGIARFLSSPTCDVEAGSVTGSIHCIAPEVLNSEAADVRSDLYSLGCVFYYMLAGAFPFDGARISDVIVAHLEHRVADISPLRPDLPKKICEWVMSLINRQPQDRYASCLDALSALQSLAAAAQGQSEFPTKPSSSAINTSPIASVPPLLAPLLAGHRHRAVFASLGAIAMALIAIVFAVKPAKPSDNAAPASAVARVQLRSPVQPLDPAVTEKVSSSSLDSALAQASAATSPGVVPDEPFSPLPAPVVLRVHGSNTIGSALLPALMERFLQTEGAVEVHRRTERDREEMNIEAKFSDGTSKAIEVQAHGSTTAFEDLAAGKCEIGIASRAIKVDEAAICERAGLGDLRGIASEHVAGLDGIAVLAHRSNAVQTLTVPQVAEIFAGHIKDWSEVGGTPGPIHLFSRDGNSGTFDTFKSLVLGSTALSTSAKRFEDSAELSDAVSADPAAIGFVGLPFVRGAKLLAISEPGAAPLLATPFTIGTEDYALSRRLFIYTAEAPVHPWVSRFVEFALSEEGQEIVARLGFVKQAADLQRPLLPAGSPPGYTKAVQNAERLSLNLRFQNGSTDLDRKSLRDMDRIGQLMTKPSMAGRQIMLFGFADNVGNASANLKLSRERAQAVARQLAMRGISAAFVEGFGAVNPVASNETELGREKNRRVEVWLRS